MQDRSRVVLPQWIWTKSKDKAHFKELVAQYLRRYPGYEVMEIGKYYAVCKVNRF